MARPIRGERYSTVAIAFHWVIALFVVVNLAVGLLHESVPAMRAWMPGHKAIGITVLALTALRIAWRLGHAAPPPPRDIPQWQQQAALATHWALYLLLIAMPLSGWLMVSGPEGRRPLTWFGVADIPYLPASGAAADAGHSAHGLPCRGGAAPPLPAARRRAGPDGSGDIPSLIPLRNTRGLPTFWWYGAVSPLSQRRMARFGVSPP
jgi:cytochrome b561